MRKLILLVFLTIALSISAQKYHRIGYVDMDYILKNVPTYLQAQNTLDAKVARWKVKIESLKGAIESLKMDLANEKVILTKDLIEEREEDIKLKQNEYYTMKNFYFGSSGEMYNLRKKLVQPIQDMVFNAVGTIAKRKKLDYVYDKSSDLVMLYAKKKHDISKLVIKLIKVDLKKQPKFNKIASREQILKEAALTPNQKKDRETRKNKKRNYDNKKSEQDSINKQRTKELLAKRQEIRKAQLKAREEKKNKEK